MGFVGVLPTKPIPSSVVLDDGVVVEGKGTIVGILKSVVILQSGGLGQLPELRGVNVDGGVLHDKLRASLKDRGKSKSDVLLRGDVRQVVRVQVEDVQNGMLIVAEDAVASENEAILAGGGVDLAEGGGRNAGLAARLLGVAELSLVVRHCGDF